MSKFKSYFEREVSQEACASTAPESEELLVEYLKRFCAIFDNSAPARELGGQVREWVLFDPKMHTERMEKLLELLYGLEQADQTVAARLLALRQWIGTWMQEPDELRRRVLKYYKQLEGAMQTV
jgi:hypothetical protein